MDDHIGSADMGREIILDYIRLHPSGLWRAPAGEASGDSYDFLNAGLVGERLDKAGTDVSCSPRDQDSHVASQVHSSSTRNFGGAARRAGYDND